MRTEELEVENVSILRLFDRIDSNSCKELKGKVNSLIDNNKLKLLLDLQNVESVDSSGLGMLISCLKSVTNAGGLLKISHLHNGTKNTFYLTRMDRIFDIFENNETALHSFR
ncbi:STAS domain-containing protein [bacterium]|nr:STAS domain-containing protein [bacterium]